MKKLTIVLFALSTFILTSCEPPEVEVSDGGRWCKYVFDDDGSFISGPCDEVFEQINIYLETVVMN